MKENMTNRERPSEFKEGKRQRKIYIYIYTYIYI